MLENTPREVPQTKCPRALRKYPGGPRSAPNYHEVPDDVPSSEAVVLAGIFSLQGTSGYFCKGKYEKQKNGLKRASIREGVRARAKCPPCVVRGGAA